MDGDGDDDDDPLVVGREVRGRDHGRRQCGGRGGERARGSGGGGRGRDMGKEFDWSVSWRKWLSGLERGWS